MKNLNQFLAGLNNEQRDITKNNVQLGLKKIAIYDETSADVDAWAHTLDLLADLSSKALEKLGGIKKGPITGPITHGTAYEYELPNGQILFGHADGISKEIPFKSFLNLIKRQPLMGKTSQM